MHRFSLFCCTEFSIILGPSPTQVINYNTKTQNLYWKQKVTEYQTACLSSFDDLLFDLSLSIILKTEYRFAYSLGNGYGYKLSCFRYLISWLLGQNFNFILFCLLLGVVEKPLISFWNLLNIYANLKV